MGSVYCAVRTDYRSQCTLKSEEAVPWLNRLVAEICTRRNGLISKTFHLGYVVDKLWHCNLFSSVLQFYPVSIIPHKLCNHLHTMSLLPEEQMVKVWKVCKEQYSLGKLFFKMMNSENEYKLLN
jgi:hypothetical protein